MNFVYDPKKCTYEPVLGGKQGQAVTKAFNAVING